MNQHFKIGDIVEPIRNTYGVTNRENNFIGQVVSIDGDYFHLKQIRCDREEYKDKETPWRNLYMSEFKLLKASRFNSLYQKLL